LIRKKTLTVLGRRHWSSAQCITYTVAVPQNSRCSN